MSKLSKNAIARNAQRIARVQALRASKNAVRRETANRAAFMLALQQQAAQYGIDPAQVAKMMGVTAQNARANSATIAPSRELVHVNGEALKPCAAVHALCATIPEGSRAEMLQLCKDNGINASTAATQVGLFRARAKAAADQASE